MVGASMVRGFRLETRWSRYNELEADKKALIEQYRERKEQWQKKRADNAEVCREWFDLKPSGIILSFAVYTEL